MSEPTTPEIPEGFEGNAPTVHPIPDASEDIVYETPVADPGSVMEPQIVKGEE
jgi:hypothetical protein